MQIEEFLRYFDNVRKSGEGYTARCSAHDDQHNSLSVTPGDGEKILVFCHAGCPAEAVCSAVGLNISVLMGQKKTGREEVAAFDYRDEEGRLLFQTVKFFPKDFAQRRPDGAGGWIWNLQGVRRVLYRLPELRALSPESVVFIVEGEKDADRMKRIGQFATTSPMGAGKWQDSYSENLVGRKVAIIPDNDEKGEEHAAKVRESLLRYKAEQVEIIRLPGLKEHGDISDWLAIEGNTPEKLEDLLYHAFRPEMEERAAIQEEISEARAEYQGRISLNPVELVANPAILDPVGYVAGTIFPKGTVSLIMGASGSGKSYFAMYLGAAFAAPGEHGGGHVHKLPTTFGKVLFLSCEMGGPELKRRTREVWSDEVRRALGDNFHFKWDFFDADQALDFGREKPWENKSVDNFERICEQANQPDIVIIDSLKRVHHSKENDNTEMAIVMATIERAARLTGTAVIVIHHFGKMNEFREGMGRGRGASAIVDFANDVLTVETISKHGEPVKSKIVFEKTRSTLVGKPGPFAFSQEKDGREESVNGRKVEGVVLVTADHIEQPREKRTKTEPREPAEEVIAKTAARVEQVLHENPGVRYTIRQLRDLVVGKTTYIINAIQGLKAQGVIEGQVGERGAVLWGLKKKPANE